MELGILPQLKGSVPTIVGVYCQWDSYSGIATVGVSCVYIGHIYKLYCHPLVIIGAYT